MIKHIEHNVGTVELAKKLNEVIRIVNDGSKNTDFDAGLLFSKIEQYATMSWNVGFFSGANNNDAKKAQQEALPTIRNEIRGMLGL